MVLGIGLPLLCLEAIEHIPENPTAGIPMNICPLGISTCASPDYDKAHFLAHDVFKIEATQLEDSVFINLSFNAPLKSAFTIVYYSKKEDIDRDAVALGSVQEMGKYKFDIKPEWLKNDFNLIIKDVLKNKIIYLETFIASK